MSKRLKVLDRLIEIEKDANRIRQMIGDSSLVIYETEEKENIMNISANGKLQFEEIPEDLEIENLAPRGGFSSSGMSHELRGFLSQMKKSGRARLGPFETVRFARRAQTLVSHITRHELKWPRGEGDKPGYFTAIRGKDGKRLLVIKDNLDTPCEAYVFVVREL